MHTNFASSRSFHSFSSTIAASAFVSIGARLPDGTSVVVIVPRTPMLQPSAWANVGKAVQSHSRHTQGMSLYHIRRKGSEFVSH